jgi:hypothetical protein
MGWFRRQKDSATDHAAETGVASDLADFRVQQQRAELSGRRSTHACSRVQKPTLIRTAN